MAVVSVVEASPPTGGWTATGERNWTRYFQVLTDSLSDGPVIVTTAAGIPTPNSLYVFGSESDGLAYAKSANAALLDSKKRTLWLVTVEYTTAEESSCSDISNDDPMAEPAVITVSGSDFQAIAIKDKDGNAVKNSAGDAFDPPVMKNDSHLTLRIEKNVATLDLNFLSDYANAVNTDTFFGLTARKWLARPANAQQVYRGDCDPYWKISMEFLSNFDQWDFSVLDQGFFKLDAGKRKRIAPDGVHGSKPSLLDGAGAVLAVGAAEVYLDFRVYKELPFADLGTTLGFPTS